MKKDKTTPKSNSKIFAIGDIHGCAQELRELIKHLPLQPNSTIIFLGDYVDRGPNSKEVIDIILNLSKTFKVVALRGNHEEMFLDFLKDENSPEGARFIYNGGSATLESYSYEPGRYKVPEDHMKFLNGLPLMYETEQFLFVHAGLPNVEIAKLDLEKHKLPMMWLRDEFFESNFNWGKTIVHGHTPVEDVELKPNRINVDTGCVYNQKLSAVQLPERIIYQINKQGETPHRFLKDKTTGRVSARFNAILPVHFTINGEIKILYTVNYSEFGILVKEQTPGLSYVFAPHDQVEGKIQLPGSSFLRFQGTVMRIEVRENQVCYGIHLDRPLSSRY